MNPLEIYRDCGARAGTAARRRDHATARFHFQWFCRAVALEPQSRRAEVRRAFNGGYNGGYNGQATTTTPP